MDKRMDDDCGVRRNFRARRKGGLAKEERDPKRDIFNVGVSFHERRNVAQNRRPGAAGEILSPTSPMISCFAFACELLSEVIVLEGRKHAVTIFRSSSNGYHRQIKGNCHSI
jgi:hypothetical protein